MKTHAIFIFIFSPPFHNVNYSIIKQQIAQQPNQNYLNFFDQNKKNSIHSILKNLKQIQTQRSIEQQQINHEKSKKKRG